MKVEFTGETNERLDHALRRAGDLSVSQAKKAIKTGALTVNGQLVRKPAFQVRPGDQVVCEFEKTETKSNHEQKPSLEILYEDDEILAIDKPSGLLSVPPSHETNEKSALDKVSRYLGEKAYAVHRLDRFASGILIFAKSLEARDQLMEEFKSRKVEKTYMAIVVGEVPEEKWQGEIDIPIDDNRPHSTVIPHQGKPAKTKYRVLKTGEGVSLVEAKTRSGRRHQVRVHLAETIGSIQGDRLYSPSKCDTNQDRGKQLALHCFEVTVPDKTIKAPIPEVFKF